MAIIIRHRHSAAELWRADVATLREALIAAVAARADLTGADLRGAKWAGKGR